MYRAARPDRAVATLVVMVLAGCPEQLRNRCGDALPPCPSGQSCIAGLCALGDDAGVSGGGAGGGTAGGGVIPACDAGCPPWAVCTVAATSAACVDGKLEVALPADRSSFTANDSLSVLASLLLPDGGVWPVLTPIPVTGSWGAFTTVASGDAGLLPGAPDAGSGVVVVGWSDGGPTISRQVSFGACWASVSCPPFLECAPDPTGGQCVSQGLVVEWLAPDAGSATNLASIAGQVRISRLDGGTVRLTSVPVSGAADFTGSAGLFMGQLPLSGMDGPVSFVAGWPDGGPSQSLTVIRDTVAPEVSVSVLHRTGPDPDSDAPSAWKKDERALVRVTVDGGRPAIAADLIPPTGAIVTDDASCSSCSGNCRCFGVDLSGTAVLGMRAVLGLQVAPIMDEAGNNSIIRDAGIEVTRASWSRKVVADVTTTAFPLAVSHQGEVVLALSYRGPVALPLVTAFTPRGDQRPMSIGSSVTSAPVLQADGIGWVGTFGSMAQIAPFSLSLGALPATNCIGPQASVLGLLRRDAGFDVVVGLSNTGSLVVNETGCPAAPGFGSGPIAMTADQQILVAANSAVPTIHKAQIDAGMLVAAGSLPLAAPGFRSLFVDSQSRAGGVLGGEFGGDGQFVFDATGTLSSATPVTRSEGLRSPASSSGTHLFGGLNDGGLAKIPYGGGAQLDGGISASTGLGQISVTPALGEGGLVYALGTSTIPDAGPTTVGARLGVLRQSDLSLVWSGDFPFTVNQTELLVEPALDTYRLRDGGRDCARPLGVLYVASRVGSEIVLRAVLVDSRGLDERAAWPKFQRDNANSANVAMPTTPWSCP